MDVAQGMAGGSVERRTGATSASGPAQRTHTYVSALNAVSGANEERAEDRASDPRGTTRGACLSVSLQKENGKLFHGELPTRQQQGFRVRNWPMYLGPRPPGRWQQTALLSRHRVPRQRMGPRLATARSRLATPGASFLRCLAQRQPQASSIKLRSGSYREAAAEVASGRRCLSRSMIWRASAGRLI